jgi:type 1 glutamine amidotransferase
MGVRGTGVTSTSTLSVLVVTGGHPFESGPFFTVFDELAADHAFEWTAGSAPASGFDVVVLYDLPGLRFTRGDPPAELIEPTAEQRRAITELTEAGTGLVFLHHAVAGWPAWPEYAEIVGGRFHYQPGSLRGVAYPDSGYRLDVTHTVEVLAPDHPVCAGLAPSFTLTDELYCFPVLDDAVVPLMRTTFDTRDATQFFSADLAIRGRRDCNDGWTHPPGSDLVAWVKHARNSPVVYLQFGDGPVAYRDRTFRRVLANAIGWVASTAAADWAAARRRAGASR